MGSRTVWAAAAVVLGGLPLVFDSVLSVGILNQMLIAVLFALSYNTLLGQGGLLSFGIAEIVQLIDQLMFGQRLAEVNFDRLGENTR